MVCAAHCFLGSVVTSVGLLIYTYQTLIYTSAKMRVIELSVVAALLPLLVAYGFMYGANMRVRIFDSAWIGKELPLRKTAEQLK